MKHGFLALLLVLCAVPAPARAGRRAEAGAVSVTVSVFNDANAPSEDLRRARVRAQSVMASAGVNLNWMDCGSPEHPPLNTGCAAISFPKHLSVRLVSGTNQVSTDVYGQTFQDAEGQGNYALVYYQRLRASAAARSINSGDLLGLVIAHELGHLLLGLASHSSAGLMSAVWGKEELLKAKRGDFFFSEPEGRRMVSRFIAAANLQTGSARSARGDGK